MKKLMILALILTNSLAYASISYDLDCHSADAYTDLGDASLSLKSVITVKGANDYVLESGSFEFFIEDAWTDQNVAINSVENKKDYRPRVYANHAKFPSISREFFGMVDFIVPHAALMSGSKNFTANFILSWVEDHWGGTITAECELSTPIL
jgi:hypothetical protein